MWKTPTRLVFFSMLFVPYFGNDVLVDNHNSGMKFNNRLCNELPAFSSCHIKLQYFSEHKTQLTSLQVLTNYREQWFKI